MKVIIAGAGVVGTALAKQLSQEGHRVVIIDRDRELLHDVAEKLDVLALLGNAASPKMLRRAGVEDTDLLIAVTNSDEVNVIVAMIGANLGVEDRMVRVRNREYTIDNPDLLLPALGINHVINPEPVVVDSVMRLLDIPGAEEVTTIAHGQVQILRFSIDNDSPVAGKTLADIRRVGALNAFLILEITRGDKTFVPRGYDTVEPGDHIYALVASDTVPFLVPMMHRSVPQTHRVIIAGASRLGIELAKKLQRRVKFVIVVEKDPERASVAAEMLEDCNVLQGDCTDLELLREAAIESCDLFCAVSEDDQRNMLAALLAKRHSQARTAVLVHQPEFIPVLDSLGVESVISPRMVTIGEILTHVRKGMIHSVTQMSHSDAELLELEVPVGSAMDHTPLKDLKFPKGALVAAIANDDIVVIPDGETIIDAGNRAFIYCRPAAIPGVEKMFATRK
ncbi:MAG: Trk system potassium transporter TrkA [Deltaproteobacteria bacterium]|nr:Trk system potassium transporter TrkA [Deltaproteobacteria bacterium]